MQTGHAHHTVTCVRARRFMHVTIHMYSLWDYALRMAYNKEARCTAHYVRRYHGWHGGAASQDDDQDNRYLCMDDSIKASHLCCTCMA